MGALAINPKLAKRLILLLLAAFLWLWPGVSPAYEVTGISLERNHKVSRLILTANKPMQYQVELDGPQVVVVHLAGADIKARLPLAQDDPLVESISQGRELGGVSLRIKTKAPGITVLPFYEASSRRLTLELGGAPSIEVQVPKQEQKPQQKQPAVPKAAPQPPEAATPAPAAQQAKKAPPLKKIQPVPPQAKTQPNPQAAPPPPPPPPPPAVLAVRLGSHAEFTRLVLDGDAPLEAALAYEGKRAVLGLKRGMLLPKAPLPRPDRRITAVKVVQNKPLRLELTLASPVKKHRLFLLAGDRKAVLDLELAKPGEKSAPPKSAPELAAKPKPEPLPAKELEVSPEMPVAEPDQIPQALPAPVQEQPQPQADQATAPEAKAARSAVKTPGEKARELASREEPRVAMASPARPVAGRYGMARGSIPPVPPPPALARPRKAAPRIEPGPQVRGKIESKPAGDEAPQVLERVRQARQQSGAGEQKAASSLQGARPPQAAYLGPKGREDAQARQLFERARLALDSRNYEEAFNLFSDFLKNYPKHTLTGEASFRLADAFLYLHERKIFPVYPQVMENYQRCIDLYPDSDQVPWALLMMGRAAMLAEEPYKAVGYFDLVVEDYPKSEYLPLALTNRGKAYLTQGKYGEALDEFREVAQKFPTSRYRRDADWGQAQALFGMARYQRAALLLKDMDRRDPELRIKDPELLYYIGEAEFQLKNYFEARRYFLWALNVMPTIRDNDIILTRVGDTYQFEGAYKAAKEIYRQVLEMFPKTDGALVARLRLAESPQKDEQHPWDIFQVQATTNAFETYQEIINNYGDRPVAELARLKLGVYYYKKKEYARSIDAMSDLLRNHPRTNFRSEADYTLNLASIGLLHQIKEKKKPVELMDAYLKLRHLLVRPNNNDMLRLLSWAYEKTGVYDRAANLYRTLLERGEDDPRLDLGLARCLMVSRDYQGVLKALDPMVMAKLEGPDSVEAASMLGRAQAALGRWSAAAQTLEQVLAKAPEHAMAVEDNYQLGKALGRLGHTQQALEALNRAQELLLVKEGKLVKLQRYLVAVEAGGIAKKAGLSQDAFDYFMEAEDNATTPRDRAQAVYEQALALGVEREDEEMAATLVRLKEMQVAPWSQMAQRRLVDMQLAPGLANVGK